MLWGHFIAGMKAKILQTVGQDNYDAREFIADLEETNLSQDGAWAMGKSQNSDWKRKGGKVIWTVPAYFLEATRSLFASVGMFIVSR